METSRFLLYNQEIKGPDSPCLVRYSMMLLNSFQRISREASVFPAFGRSQILRPHIHDGSMKIKDLYTLCFEMLRCRNSMNLHWRLLATALAGSFLFRCVLESWNWKHPFWEAAWVDPFAGGKGAVCFSSHNLAVVDSDQEKVTNKFVDRLMDTAFSLHALQPAIGRVEPSPQPATYHFVSVSKSFTPPWPVAAKVLESHLPSPPKKPKNASKSGCEILFSLQIRLLGW